MANYVQIQPIECFVKNIEIMPTLIFPPSDNAILRAAAGTPERWGATYSRAGSALAITLCGCQL